jgi:hypothetical protein
MRHREKEGERERRSEERGRGDVARILADGTRKRRYQERESLMS